LDIYKGPRYMLKLQENVNDEKNKVRKLKLHPKYTLKIMTTK